MIIWDPSLSVIIARMFYMASKEETWENSVLLLTKMLDFPAKLLLEVSQRRHFFAYSEDNLGVRAETTHNSD